MDLEFDQPLARDQGEEEEDDEFGDSQESEDSNKNCRYCFWMLYNFIPPSQRLFIMMMLSVLLCVLSSVCPPLEWITIKIVQIVNHMMPLCFSYFVLSI